MRLLSLLVFAIDGAWLGGFALPDVLRWVLAVVALASLAALPWLARHWNGISEAPHADRVDATTA